MILRFVDTFRLRAAADGAGVCLDALRRAGRLFGHFAAVPCVRGNFFLAANGTGALVLFRVRLFPVAVCMRRGFFDGLGLFAAADGAGVCLDALVPAGRIFGHFTAVPFVRGSFFVSADRTTALVVFRACVFPVAVCMGRGFFDGLGLFAAADGAAVCLDALVPAGRLFGHFAAVPCVRGSFFVSAIRADALVIFCVCACPFAICMGGRLFVSANGANVFVVFRVDTCPVAVAVCKRFNALRLGLAAAKAGVEALAPLGAGSFLCCYAGVPIVFVLAGKAGGVKVHGRVAQRVISGEESHRVPFFLRAAVVDIRHFRVTAEGILFDQQRLFRNENLFQCGGSLGIKSTFRYSFNIRKCQILDAIAAVERFFSNARNAVRNRNARQAAAVVERILTNARNAVRNHNIRCRFSVDVQIMCVIQRIAIGSILPPTIRGFNLEIDIAPCRQVGNIDSIQAAAEVEHLIADARHAVADRYARQAATAVECTAADARHTITDCSARQIAAVVERIITNARHTVLNHSLFNFCSIGCPMRITRIVIIFGIILHRAGSGNGQCSLFVQHPS